MLNSYQRKASLGLSLSVVGMFAAPAQDLLQDVPVLPAPTEPVPLPEVVPDLPNDDLSEAPLPPAGVTPDDFGTVPLEPTPLAPDSNLLIPGSELVPSPDVPALPGDGTTDDDLLTLDDDAVDTSLLEDNADDSSSDRETPDALQSIGDTSFNGQPRSSDTEGWSFGVRLIENYNSNLELASSGGDSTLFTQISPSFSYRSAPSGEARLILAGSYTPTLSIYHSGSQGEIWDHDLQGSVTYEGEKLIIGLSAAYGRVNAPNRFTQSFTRSISSSIGINATYAISEKTTLSSGLEYQTRSTNTQDNLDSDVLAFNTSALWDISPKLRLGPSFRYATNKSDAIGSASSAGLGADIRYEFSEKTDIAATLGLEQTSFPGQSDSTSPTGSIRISYRPSPVLTWRGEARYEAIPLTQAANVGAIGDDPLDSGLNGAASDGDSQFNTSIGVTYRPGELWSYSGTLSRRTAPSFSGEAGSGGNIIDTSISLGVNRNIGNSSVGLGVSQSFTEFEGGTREDQEFTQFTLTYEQPTFFLENLAFAADLSHSMSSGGISYDQTEASITLGYRF